MYISKKEMNGKQPLYALEEHMNCWYSILINDVILYYLTPYTYNLVRLLTILISYCSLLPFTDSFIHLYKTILWMYLSWVLMIQNTKLSTPTIK